jgi:Flp pilus assembly pilin Flp
MRRHGSGQAVVEYMVLLAMASLVAIATVSLAGHQVSNLFGRVSSAIANPAGLIAPSTSPTPASTVATAGHD